MCLFKRYFECLLWSFFSLTLSFITSTRNIHFYNLPVCMVAFTLWLLLVAPSCEHDNRLNELITHIWLGADVRGALIGNAISLLGV